MIWRKVSARIRIQIRKSLVNEKESNISVDPYSLASYYCECIYNDSVLSSATCFISRRDGQLFLVTNWHVVTGRDADTQKPLDNVTGALPNRLRIFMPIDNGNETCDFEEDAYQVIELYDGEMEMKNQRWLKCNFQIINYFRSKTICSNSL